MDNLGISVEQVINLFNVQTKLLAEFFKYKENFEKLAQQIQELKSQLPEEDEENE